MLRAWGLAIAVAVWGLSCRPLEPSKGRPPASLDALQAPTGAVEFSLDRESFAALTEQPVTLRARIYAVVNEVSGEQEGSDQTFPIADGAEHRYQVQGLRLGMKEIGLDVLNAASEVVGEGRVRLLVKLGPQSLDDVTQIKLHAPERTRRGVAFEFFVMLMGAPSQSSPTSYLDVKPLFDKNCATRGCHSGSAPASGLDLTVFPFISASFKKQTDLVRDLLTWIANDNGNALMPPKAPLPAAEIAAINKWFDDGLPAAPVGTDDLHDLATELVLHYQLLGSSEKGELHVPRGTDGAHPFKGVWANAVVSGKYDLIIDVFAKDGSKTYTKTLQGQLIDGASSLSATCEVPYQTPQVSIPVVVGSP